MRDTLRKNVKARNEKSASGHSSLKKQGWKKYKYYDIMKWYLHANKKRRYVPADRSSNEYLSEVSRLYILHLSSNC